MSKVVEIEPNDGLKKRREAEWSVFSNGNYEGINMEIENYYEIHRRHKTLYNPQNY